MIKKIFYAIISIIIVTIATYHNIAYGYISATIILFLYISYFSGKDLITRKRNWEMPKIENNKPTEWGWVVSHHENFKLGINTDIGFGTYIQAESCVVIEENVQIGSHCSIYSKNTIDRTSGKILIKKGACIGAGTVILPKNGTTLIIGENAKVGSLSLVNEDIPDNCICFGVPIKYYYW